MLDLYEREPLSLLVAAFLWGAVAATTLAGIANVGWGLVVARLGGPAFASKWTAALTAPFVEEIIKGLGVVLIYLIARAEVDDVIDGFVYGALWAWGSPSSRTSSTSWRCSGATRRRAGGLLPARARERALLARAVHGPRRDGGRRTWCPGAVSCRGGGGCGRGRRSPAVAVFGHFLWNSPLLDLFPDPPWTGARLVRDPAGDGRQGGARCWCSSGWRCRWRDAASDGGCAARSRPRSVRPVSAATSSPILEDPRASPGARGPRCGRVRATAPPACSAGSSASRCNLAMVRDAGRARRRSGARRAACVLPFAAGRARGDPRRGAGRRRRVRPRPRVGASAARPRPVGFASVDVAGSSRVCWPASAGPSRARSRWSRTARRSCRRSPPGSTPETGSGLHDRADRRARASASRPWPVSSCATARDRDERVAVLAVDPTSPFTGGALLGDRVRMQEHATDPGVFIRSMATRGHLGGMALAAPEAVRILDAAGYDLVVVETVGVGQAEVDVAAATDTTIVVLAPGAGDAVQMAKAGILEIADVFVVNKGDRDGARRGRARSAADAPHGRRARVVATGADRRPPPGPEGARRAVDGRRRAPRAPRRDRRPGASAGATPPPRGREARGRAVPRRGSPTPSSEDPLPRGRPRRAPCGPVPGRGYPGATAAAAD